MKNKEEITKQFEVGSEDLWKIAKQVTPRQMYNMVKKCKLDFFFCLDTITINNITYKSNFPWYWNLFWKVRLSINEIKLHLRKGSIQWQK